MLFSEYCKLRCHTGGISMKEVKLLGIDKKKGWLRMAQNCSGWLRVELSV